MVAAQAAACNVMREAVATYSGEPAMVGGEPGLSQACKLVNNAISMAALAVACEATVVGVKAGLDLEKLLYAINRSSGRSDVTETKKNFQSLSSPKHSLTVRRWTRPRKTRHFSPAMLRRSACLPGFPWPSSPTSGKKLRPEAARATLPSSFLISNGAREPDLASRKLRPCASPTTDIPC